MGVFSEKLLPAVEILSPLVRKDPKVLPAVETLVINERLLCKKTQTISSN